MNWNLWGALGLVAVLAVSHVLAYQRGRQAVMTEDAETVHALHARLSALTVALNAAKGERAIVYRDRIKVIRNETDDCMDRLLPVPAVGQLRADDPVPP